MNVVPAFISLCFLIDSLRRLQLIAKGVLHIETAQMVWHIWSFMSVVIAGILLSVTTRHAFQHADWFYFTYYLIVLLIFMCELPFIYIISRVID